MTNPQLKLPFKTAGVKHHPGLKHPGVYAIVHRRSGRAYIGSTSRAAGVTARLNEHRSKLRCGHHSSRRLQLAFNKYGIEAFDFLLLESCPAKQAKQREQTYLDQRRPDSYNTLQSVKEYRPYSLATRGIIAERASKPFSLEFEGAVHSGKNLAAFCRGKGLHQGAMTQVLLGKKPQFKGWTLPGKALPPRRIRNYVTGVEISVAYFEGHHVARQLGLNGGTLNKVLNGESEVYRGWHLAGNTPTEEAVKFSFLSKAELARVNGRRSALTLTGQPRRRRKDSRHRVQ